MLQIMQAKYPRSWQSRRLSNYQDSVAISGMIKKYMEEKNVKAILSLERSLT